jgi:hypothetical protein
MIAAALTIIVALAGEMPDSSGKIASDADAVNPHGLDERKSCGVRCCVFLDQYLGGSHSYDDVLDPIEVHIEKILAGGRAPVTKQPRLHVLQL